MSKAGVDSADAPEMAELGLIEPLGNILSQLSKGGGAKGINIDAVSDLTTDAEHFSFGCEFIDIHAMNKKKHARPGQKA